MFKYSVTQWIYGKESLEASLIRLGKYGYDGVELAGEPYTNDLGKTKSLLARHGLVCTSICGIFTPQRDLSSSDPSVQAGAVQYVKDCIDMAAELGAAHVITVPSPVGKLQAGTSRDEEWNNAVTNVREAGQYALSRKINLAVEALNRYETYLVNNLEASLSFVKEVNVESVRMMADLFHMNIEERDSSEALRHIAPYLIHVHIADNTREAAGLGQIDFAKIVDTLKAINYRGPITMEFLPTLSNPYLVTQQIEPDDLYDAYTEQSIRHIKNLVGE